MAIHGRYDLPRRDVRAHRQPRWQRVFRFRMPAAAIVDLADLALDEARRDQRDGDAARRELVAQRFGECANGELAHRIRRRIRRRDVARDTADQHEPALGFDELGQTRFARLDGGEHVRLELAAIVLDVELLEWPYDAETGVRDCNVEVPESLDRERDGRVEV